MRGAIAPRSGGVISAVRSLPRSIVNMRTNRRRCSASTICALAPSSEMRRGAQPGSATIISAASSATCARAETNLSSR